jgi:predicted thioesterase
MGALSFEEAKEILERDETCKGDDTRFRHFLPTLAGLDSG